VVRHPLRIEFFEKVRFLAAGGIEKIVVFHGKALKKCPRAKVAYGFAIRNGDPSFFVSLGGWSNCLFCGTCAEICSTPCVE
jgi:hypothetical protein